MTAEPTRGELLTFLIADVRGYSAFTSAHGDEAAARLAGAFAEVAREVIEAHGGDLRELRGDEALGVFASAREALRAAVEMQATFADETARRPGLPLRVGIGLDAGEAIPVEQGYRSGALNLAARLCADAGPGEVLASQGVVHLARQMQGLRFEELGSRTLKGFDSPVPVVGVLAAAERISIPAGVAVDAATTITERQPTSVPPTLDASAAMVGRDREARLGRLLWRRARRGEGGTLLLLGEPGSGRTRLAAEVAALASRDGAIIVAGPDAPPTSGGPSVPGASAPPAPGGPPMLIVIDDADSPGEDPERVAALAADAPGRPLLVIATLVALPATGALRTLADDPRPGVTVLRLGPLDADAVRAIAASYRPDAAPGDPPSNNSAAPVQRILEVSGGNAARVHRAAAEWAISVTSDRLAEATARTSAGWTDQRAREARLARDLMDVQTARDRLPALVSDDRDTSPFKGLAPFEPEDAGWFFGRERLVADLLARATRSPLLGVVGPSGAGKSSLLRAGLVAGLGAGLLPGSETWPVALLRPGAEPSRALDRALYAAAPASLRPALVGADRPLDALVGGLPPGSRLVVVVDQFEELFTQGATTSDAAAFADALTGAVRDHPEQVLVVLGVRADLYGRCAALPDLAALLGENHVLVGPMDRDELRRAIERPALRAGLRVDPPLVDALLDEAEGEPGALPLLSTALFELWGRRDGRLIPLRALVSTGGIRGAVGRLAESTLGSFAPSDARTARALLLRLVSVADDGTAVRRRVPLASVDPDAPSVRRVLDALAARRLVTIDEGTLELSHDALLLEWPRLRGWIAEDAEGRRTQERLMLAARDWDAHGRDPGELYRGARLAAALEWSAAHDEELNDLERTFLAAGHAAERGELEQQRRTNRRLRGLLAVAAAGLVLAVGTGLLAASQWRSAEQRGSDLSAANDQLGIANERLAETLGELRTTTDLALVQGLANQSLVESGVDRSLRLARQAYAADPDSAQAQRALLAATRRAPAAAIVLRPTEGTPIELAASPDGTLVAVGFTDPGSVQLLDASTGQPVGEPIPLPAERGIRALRFSPDGQCLAIGMDDPNLGSRASARVWDLVEGDLIADLDLGRLEHFQDLAWTPDGAGLIAATEPGDGASSISLWDPASGARLARVPGGPKLTMDVGPGFGTYSPIILGVPGTGNRFVALVGDGLRVMDLPSLQVESTLPVQVDWDGRLLPLAGVSPDGSAAYVNEAGTETLTRVGLADGTKTPLSVSARRLMTMDAAGKVIAGVADDLAVTDVETGSVVSVATPVDRIGALAITGDGSRVWTAGEDGLLVAWDMDGSDALATEWRTAPAYGYHDPLVVRPDGAVVAIPDERDYLQLIDADSHEVLLADAPDGARFRDLVWSDDGRWFAAIGEIEETRPCAVDPAAGCTEYISHEQLEIWDAETLERRWVQPLDDTDNRITFSPDGSHVGIADTVWTEDATGEVTTPRSFVTMRSRESGDVVGTPFEVGGAGVSRPAFSPDGSRYALLFNVDADEDCCAGWQRLGVIDAVTGAVIWEVALDDVRFGDFGSDIRYGSDGTTVQLSTGSGAFRHDAETGERLEGPLGVSGLRGAMSYDMSRDGRLLAVGRSNETIGLLDGRTLVEIASLEDHPSSVTVRFTGDGRDLLAWNANGILTRWEIDPAAWAARACSVSPRALTPQEWADLGWPSGFPEPCSGG